MANKDVAFGFRPVSHRSGPLASTPTFDYSIASGYSQDINTGDTVKLTGTKNNISRSVADEAFEGIFGGVQYVDSEGKVQNKQKWKANTVATKVKAVVYGDPDTIFEAQCDGTFSEDNIGQYVNQVSASGSLTAGDDVTGMSGDEVDISTASNTKGTKTFQIKGVSAKAGNEVGANTVVELVIANKA